MYKLENLQPTELAVMVSFDSKTWLPARPESYSGWWGLKQRLNDAWAVFTGKADAFMWPGEQ